MAIKVNGTVVVDDSRQLTNIASFDATTVAALGSAGLGGGSISLTLTGSASAGDPIGVNSSGNAEVTAGISGLDSTITTSGHANYVYLSDASCSVSSSKTVFFYNKSNETYVARCGVIQSDGSYSFGSETVIDTVRANSGHAAVCPDTGVICVFYKRNDGSSFATVAKSVTVTGTNTVNVGSSISHGAGNKNAHCVRPMGNGKFGIFNDQNASLVTCSGTSITKNSTTTIDDDIRTVVWVPDSSQFALTSLGYGGRFRQLTVSGSNTFSSNSYRDISSGGWDRLLGWYDTYSNKMIRVVQDGSYFRIQSWDVDSSNINDWSLVSELSLPASDNSMWANSSNLNQGLFMEETNSGFAHYKVSGAWRIDEIITNASGTPEVKNSTSANSQVGLGSGFGVLSTMDQTTLSVDNTMTVSYLNYGTTLASFIGFAETSASNGQTIDVTVDGGINSSQSGLVAGEIYGLADTAVLQKGSKPQVGVALSATSILVGTGRNT